MKVLHMGIVLCMIICVYCQYNAKNIKYSNKKSNIGSNVNEKNRKNQFQNKNQGKQTGRVQNSFSAEQNREKKQPSISQGAQKVGKISSESSQKKTTKIKENIPIDKKNSMKSVPPKKVTGPSKESEMKKPNNKTQTMDKKTRNSSDIKIGNSAKIVEPSNQLLISQDAIRLNNELQEKASNLLNMKIVPTQKNIEDDDKNTLQEGERQDHLKQIEQIGQNLITSFEVDNKNNFQLNNQTGRNSIESNILPQKNIAIQVVSQMIQNKIQEIDQEKKLEIVVTNHQEKQSNTNQIQEYSKVKSQSTAQKMKDESQWRQDYLQFCKTHKCPKCGSTKITRSIRGKPYMPYVEFHEKLSNQLGYTTLKLSGCTQSTPSFCAQCKTQIPQGIQRTVQAQKTVLDRQFFTSEANDSQTQKELSNFLKFNFLYLMLLCGIILLTNYLYNRFKFVKFVKSPDQSNISQKPQKTEALIKDEKKKKNPTKIEKKNENRRSKRQSRKIN